MPKTDSIQCRALLSILLFLALSCFGPDRGGKIEQQGELRIKCAALSTAFVAPGIESFGQKRWAPVTTAPAEPGVRLWKPEFMRVAWAQPQFPDARLIEAGSRQGRAPPSGIHS